MISGILTDSPNVNCPDSRSFRVASSSRDVLNDSQLLLPATISSTVVRVCALAKSLIISADDLCVRRDNGHDSLIIVVFLGPELSFTSDLH